MVHRDLKPSNILVDSAGLFKICDFGLASAAREGHGGTPAYMPPEAHKAYGLMGFVGGNSGSSGDDSDSSGGGGVDGDDDRGGTRDIFQRSERHCSVVYHESFAGDVFAMGLIVWEVRTSGS